MTKKTTEPNSPNHKNQLEASNQQVECTQHTPSSRGSSSDGSGGGGFVGGSGDDNHHNNSAKQCYC